MGVNQKMGARSQAAHICTTDAEAYDLVGIAKELSRLSASLNEAAAAFDVDVAAGSNAFREVTSEETRPTSTRRQTRQPLPDPRMIRRIIRQRQLRARYFNSDLFADPAWDILLDLTAARAEHKRVSVTSACIASGVPATTALRWIGELLAAKLVERVEDDQDRRRAFIALTDRGADAMAKYFAEWVQ